MDGRKHDGLLYRSVGLYAPKTWVFPDCPERTFRNIKREGRVFCRSVLGFCRRFKETSKEIETIGGERDGDRSEHDLDGIDFGRRKPTEKLVADETGRDTSSGSGVISAVVATKNGGEGRTDRENVDRE